MITSIKTVHKLSMSEFLQLLVQAYNITTLQAIDWLTDRAVRYNMRNGEQLVVDVEKCEFDSYDEWLRDLAPPNAYDCDADCTELLCDMANRDLIPEGLYIIDYSW